APESGKSGVLFHGMAGAGKSACALELAYTHEQAFERLIWHKAPDEDHDITMALNDFALTLEGALPRLAFVAKLAGPRAFASFLPQLTSFVARYRVLIVLDNAESLLSSGGAWRDPRWGELIDALSEHEGYGRLVITTRTRPAALDARMVVEP